MKLHFAVASICLFAMPLTMAAQKGSKVQKSDFGKVDGQQIYLYTLKNSHGMEVAITNYGAAVVSIKVPDNKGKIGDVTLGYDNVQGYVTDKSYFGATAGRYANRIAGGEFTLDGKKYQIPRNDGPNALHGGPVGFNKRIWTEKDLSGNAIQMSYLSPDGEEGFPGNLKVAVTFTLTDQNELRFHYLATTDKDTVLNLTNHTYFNLGNQGNGDILGTELTIHASKFTPVDKTLIPTGDLASVKGTPFDFTSPHKIGERIGEQNEQLKLGRGYDHNFVLDRTKPGMFLAVHAYDSRSGRVLEVLTDQPGVQFYSGNFLDGSAKGKGSTYNYRTGFCLETQHFPDSPNHPKFPSTELKPGQKYETTTIFRFSTK
ncbi:MAG TPA: aldose epimerase family protein [Terriglobales bacterium]|nr:aldose epimerase family protein [Terriglobales bacterium]